MPSSNALTVSLTPELRQFIEAQVAAGRYRTASEVVRAGLRLLTRADPPPAIGLRTPESSDALPKD
ncbi:type II toxin-antitoxin system ParD family antitoxin [Roseomonas sp. M0104]|uniref:Type II toxin-antitoxin system ParD family antitoxin n=1 Tax=Teichococcus coralli TaxID=2545983 RepID=A0A845BCW5_9PROT|nr:type II toxin-antitoxin system ParD family antitoxin [Pseudoroseomonas coralli]MXP64735.1 type II toxin-antitoxin system ParD family antitoxin [Pseudoroseomonas coralli]